MSHSLKSGFTSIHVRIPCKRYRDPTATPETLNGNLPWDEDLAVANPEAPTAPTKKGPKRKLIIASAIALFVIGSLVAGGLILKASIDAEAAAKAERSAQIAENEAEAKEAAQRQRDSDERAERKTTVEEIERSITTMAEGHVADDLIDGPIIDVTCSPLGGGSTDDLTEQTTVFDCFVANKDNGDGTMSGYKYNATMNWSTGQFTYGMGAA